MMQIAPDEAWLSFDQEAYVLHNKVILPFFLFNFAVKTCIPSRFVHSQDGLEHELRLSLLMRKSVTTIS